jgi:hypothetical protein
MLANVVGLFDCKAVWAAAMLQGNSSACGVDHAGWAGRPARTGVLVRMKGSRLRQHSRDVEPAYTVGPVVHCSSTQGRR